MGEKDGEREREGLGGGILGQSPVLNTVLFFLSVCLSTAVGLFSSIIPSSSSSHRTVLISVTIRVGVELATLSLSRLPNLGSGACRSKQSCAPARARSNNVPVTRSTGHSHAIIPPSWPTGPLVSFYRGNGNRREVGSRKIGVYRRRL